MTKIDIIKHLEQAESYINQLDESVTDENALTENLTNLIDVLKPIGGDSLNYKIFSAAVSEILNFNDGYSLDTSIKKKKTSKIGAIVDFFQSLKLNSSYDRKELANSSKDNIDEKESEEKEKSDEKKPESSPKSLKSDKDKSGTEEEPKDELRLEKKKLAVKTLGYLFNCIKKEFDVEDKNINKPQIIITSEEETKSPESE